MNDSLAQRSVLCLLHPVLLIQLTRSGRGLPSSNLSEGPGPGSGDHGPQSRLSLPARRQAAGASTPAFHRELTATGSGHRPSPARLRHVNPALTICVNFLCARYLSPRVPRAVGGHGWFPRSCSSGRGVGRGPGSRPLMGWGSWGTVHPLSASMSCSVQ